MKHHPILLGVLLALCSSISLSVRPHEPFPIPPTLTPPCVNTFRDCARWAIFPLYYCEPSSEFSDFMIQNCPAACGVCGKQPPPPPVDPDTEPEPKYTTEKVDRCELVMCDYIPCTEDEVWSQAEGECCGGCVKRPDKGCAPVYRPVLDAIVNMDGATCYARGTMYTSACFGSCASLGAFLKNGIKMKECSCCDANEVEKVLLPVSCVPPKGPPGTMQIAALYDDFYEYDLITSCACNKFKCGDEWEPEGEEHKLKDLYNDVILNVNEYNGHV